jgi:hypothetical protein
MLRLTRFAPGVNIEDSEPVDSLAIQALKRSVSGCIVGEWLEALQGRIPVPDPSGRQGLCAVPLTMKVNGWSGL